VLVLFLVLFWCGLCVDVVLMIGTVPSTVFPKCFKLLFQPCNPLFSCPSRFLIEEFNLFNPDLHYMKSLSVFDASAVKKLIEQCVVFVAFSFLKI